MSEKKKKGLFWLTSVEPDGKRTKKSIDEGNSSIQWGKVISDIINAFLKK